MPTSAPSSTTTPPTCSCPATPFASTPTSGLLEETEIDAFIGQRWLVTVRKDEGFSMEPVLARWDRSPDLAVIGVGFLLYGLLDVVVDGYFDTIQRVRRVLRRGQRADLLRAARSSRRSNDTGSRSAGPSSGSTGSSCRCARR